jgi:YD repeat-containing protein
MFEKQWIFQGFAGGSSASTGLWEQRRYDWNLSSPPTPPIGRLLEVHTVGVAAAGEAGSSEGLVHVYGYDSRTEFSKSLEISAIGVKKGTAGDTAWVKQFIRDPERTDLVTLEIDYFSPPSALRVWSDSVDQEELETIDATKALTYRGYDLEEAPGAQPWEQSAKRVLAEVTIRPPVPAPDTNALRFPIDITRVDYSKTPYTDRWHGYGETGDLDGLLGSDPQLGATATQFFYDLTRQDGSGNTVLTCVDIDDDYPTLPSNRNDLRTDAGISAAEPQCPPSWDRVPGASGSATPLNHWAITRFSNAGPIRSENHRHTGTIWVYGHDIYPEPPEFAEYPWESTRTYSNLTYDANGAVKSVDGPGQIAYYGPDVSPDWRFGQGHSWGTMGYTPTLDSARRVLTHVQSVNWDVPEPTVPPTPITITGSETFTVIADLGLEGPSGAPTSVKVTSGAEAREAKIAYTNLGEIQRQLHPDDTIIRNVYDPFGKLLRVYRGTKDTHWYWGNMTAPEYPCQTPPAAPADDNLVLVEKRTYGTGVTDANQVIRTRSYRDKPSDQYHSCPTSTHNEDDIGWSTEFQFDWRMRPVATINHAEGPNSAPALLHTITHVDALSRTRFVAVYGPNGPDASVNPANSSLDPFSTPPTAVTILGATPRPLRLSETIYNARGQVAEQHEYDVQSDPPAYTATITHYDFADRPIRVLQPGGREERSVYNAKGQLVAQSTYAAGMEIARNEHDYDDEGNAVITRSLERTGTSGTTLDSSNAVTSFAHKWYDQNKRLIATADWGTASPAFTSSDPRVGKYATGPSPTRATAAPAPVYTGSRITDVNRGTIPGWVKISCFEYDDQGRESAIVHPNLAVTRKFYNGFGELTKQVDNADVENPVDPARRVTAYRYDDGRLIKIAAILFNDYTDPDWESHTGEVQITELKYEAEVVGPTGASFSPQNFNHAWVSQVNFPDPVTGLPSAQNFLKFKYYITGEIAEREDPRGTKIRYRYDELGRCTRTEIDTSSYQTPGGERPIDLVARIDYSYDTLGNLRKATAWRSIGQGGTPPESDLIAESEFSYDHHGNLQWERQQHGGHAGTDSPTMSYGWEWRKYETSVSNSNHNRLISMTYPDRNAGSGVSRRELDFEYGDYSTQSSVDDALCRITGIRATGLTPAAARYEYAGQGRRVQLRLADLLSASQPDTAAAIQRLSAGSFTQAGLDGLDHFAASSISTSRASAAVRRRPRSTATPSATTHPTTAHTRRSSRFRGVLSPMTTSAPSPGATTNSGG